MFDIKHLRDGHCFLCGISLSEENRSEEHVVPRWLQEDLGLWDEKITLLNHTTIPYRQLVIPCCIDCNTGPLAELEGSVSSILQGEFIPIDKDEEYLIFQWCAKLLFGLLRKEMTLVVDQTGKVEGSIVPSEFLEDLDTFHHFLTSTRRPFRFVDFEPYSVFVVHTHEWDDPKANFDYYDFVTIGVPEEQTLAMSIAIRVKAFGIICIFEDNGFQKKYFQDQFARLNGIPLHPIQFLELACKAAYKHSLLAFSPRYHSIAGESSDSEVVVLQANSPRKYIWEDWDPEVYEHLFMGLAHRAGFEEYLPDKLYIGDSHHTWLSDETGAPLRMISPKSKESGPD